MHKSNHLRHVTTICAHEQSTIGQSDQNNSATVSKLRSQPDKTGYILINPSQLPWCCVTCHNFDLSCKSSDQIALFQSLKPTVPFLQTLADTPYVRRPTSYDILQCFQSSAFCNLEIMIVFYILALSENVAFTKCSLSFL